MTYVYEFDNTYTKQDKLNELHAYMKTESEVFNFGEGEMSMSLSESTYYRIEIDMLDGSYWERQYPFWNDVLENEEVDIPDTPTKLKKNKYYINHIRQKQRNHKLYNETKMWYPAPFYIDLNEDSEYLKRSYRGSRSKFLKKISNRKIRRNKDYYPKGNKVKRQFDFWHTMY